jgi:hypothetical protein
MSFILRYVRPQNIQSWIAANAPGSLRNTAKESWRAYLLASGGTGQSLAQLEDTAFTALGATGSSSNEKCRSNVDGTAGNTTAEKARNKYK